MFDPINQNILDVIKNSFSKPRAPQRIDGFLELLKAVWKESPDLRFGQLICNLLPYEGMLFYLEDRVLADLLLAEKHRIEAEKAGKSIALAISLLQKEGFANEKIATLLNLSEEQIGSYITEEIDAGAAAHTHELRGG